jgi:hypothetical protein
MTATPSDVKVTPGSGKNVATYSFTGEDSETKELQRVVLNTSAGVEIDTTTPGANFPLPVTPVSGLTTSMTGTTSTAVAGIGAAGSGKFNYITQITVANAHATVGTNVELQDGSGGTTFFVIPAAPAYGGASIAFPTPLKQPTANTALYAKDTTTGAAVIVSAVGFQA